MLKILQWKKKPKTTEQQKLDEIEKLLFPPYKLNKGSDGSVYQIDYSVDWNLEAAIIDLENGVNDKTTQNTIKYVVERLIKVRKIFNDREQVLDKNAQYFIVDDLSEEEDEIVALEEPST